MVTYNKILVFIALAFVASAVSSCYDPHQKASPESTTQWEGIEYAPQMYHSEAYDPLTQINDTSAGLAYWPFEKVGGGVSNYYNLEEGHGEWFNSNYYNEHGMNMREPVEKAIARGQMPYMLSKDSVDMASMMLPAVDKSGNIYAAHINDSSAKFVTFEENIDECKELYLRFCSHCHGIDGQADGKVAEKFGGVPTYNSVAVKDKPIGHIFHVITHGIRRMGSHSSQLSQKERWMIATYVQELQKK